MMKRYDQIGPYQVEREIGRGAMGVVYLGRDKRLDRLVAIKVLPVHLATEPDRLARFEGEGRALARLNHSNVAGIYGVEEQNDQKFLVLEYVEGQSLADRLKGGPIAVDESLRLAIEIAAGVAAAHDVGVIHRDLKPDNIKITTDGRIKVLDFGLAKAVAPNTGITTADSPTLTPRGNPSIPGAILGTPAYMSPEQARGLGVDSRTDIWSFGVILYEMLSGRNPFHRESIADSLGAILHEEIDLSAIRSSVPANVIHILRRCLERDPSRRWRSIADIQIELEDARTVHHSVADAGSQIANRSFRLSDNICRLMDREGFDPLVLGWDAQYADNERGSSVLVLWIPSFGGDHTTARHRQLMDACPYRMITPTLIGMEPHAAARPQISIENQLLALRALASDLRVRLGPKRLVIGGSSCGGILALRCAAGNDDPGLFDGVLVIDPDLEESDCFVTKLFADLEPDSERSALDAVKMLSASCETLEEWVSMHEYMAQCIEKMQHDITPLINQARELVAPYRGICSGSNSPFLGWLRDACDKTAVVRCVLPDNQEKHRLVGEIRLMHLDCQCLGPRFNDNVVSFVPASTHFEVLRPEHMANCITEFVQEILAP